MTSRENLIANRIIKGECVAIVLLAMLAGWQASMINEQARTGHVLWALFGGTMGFAITRLILRLTINR